MGSSICNFKSLQNRFLRDGSERALSGGEVSGKNSVVREFERRRGESAICATQYICHLWIEMTAIKALAHH